jgi:glucosylceramidase
MPVTRAFQNLIAWITLGAVGTAPLARGVDVWITTGDKSQLIRQNTDAIFQPGTGSGGTIIQVVPGTTYQSMSGFGAALTDSSAWLLQNKMSAAQRDKLMRQLFSPDAGIGLSYLRVPMGASDFTASGFYTYNDNPSGGSDGAQTKFSVAHDDAYIVPRLQQALRLNPALKLMASPWSAPAWMKTNNSLIGGSLAAQWEESYARYLVKFVQAYAQRGLPIDTITLQNEPLNTSNYPTMFMSAAQQARIIADQLGPQFAANGINTKIIAYDHNWDRTDYPLEVLSNTAARPYVAGTAFHAYAGNVSAQTTVHNAFPDKDVYFTEISGGNWATNFSDNLIWYSQNIIIGGTQNWAKNALLWNLALDQNSNPHLGGCADCRGVVTVDSNSGNVTFNEEFYVLGQAAKVVQPGAFRIGSTTASNINTVAFLNPDGSRALLALNPNAAAATLRLYEKDQHFVYQLPGKSLASFLWHGAGADFDNGTYDVGGYQHGGGSLDAWTIFGNPTGNVSVSGEEAFNGDNSLKLYGQFTGAPNTSGVYQGISVHPGDFVRASTKSFIRGLDSIAGTGNLVQMKIEFYSQYGAARDSQSFLTETMRTIADGASTNDGWLAAQLAETAPAGAAEARLVLQFKQPDNQAGAVYLDGVSFSAGPPGDLNGDGTVDSADLDVWRAAFGSSSSADADGDGDADGADFMIWQRQLSAPAPADANGTPECSSCTLACISGVTSAICSHRGSRHCRPLHKRH